MISIVIINWNTRNRLSECLMSIISEPNSDPYEILVVDNHSDDASSQMVRTKFPQVKLLEMRENVGFARANNIAIWRSRGDHKLLLNPDTLVKPDTIRMLSRFLDTNPGAGAVGPKILSPGGLLQFSASREPTLRRGFSRLFHLEAILPSTDYGMSQWSSDKGREVDVLMGASIMVRKTALDEVGAFDEDFFMYSEEVDLCHRLRKAGWGVHWTPQAQIVHHGGQASKQVPMESFLNLYKGKIRYFRKHHGMVAAFAFKLVLTVASLSRLVVSPLALFQQPEQRDRHMALANRYLRLLAEMPEL